MSEKLKDLQQKRQKAWEIMQDIWHGELESGGNKNKGASARYAKAVEIYDTLDAAVANAGGVSERVGMIADRSC